MSKIFELVRELKLCYAAKAPFLEDYSTIYKKNRQEADMIC
jgi:hypothetical protein